MSNERNFLSEGCWWWFDGSDGGYQKSRTTLCQNIEYRKMNNKVWDIFPILSFLPPSSCFYDKVRIGNEMGDG